MYAIAFLRTGCYAPAVLYVQWINKKKSHQAWMEGLSGTPGHEEMFHIFPELSSSTSFRGRLHPCSVKLYADDCLINRTIQYTQCTVKPHWTTCIVLLRRGKRTGIWYSNLRVYTSNHILRNAIPSPISWNMFSMVSWNYHDIVRIYCHDTTVSLQHLPRIN